MSNTTTNSTANWPILRPFGSLPTESDEPFDKGIIAAGTITGTLAVVHIGCLMYSLIRRSAENNKYAQRNNLLLILFSQVSICFGVIGSILASDAYTQVMPLLPMNQPLYAQAFSCLAFVGTALLLLPSLIPQAKIVIEGGKMNIQGNWVVSGVAIALAFILVSFEITVLALGFDKTKREVLITLFTFELFTIVVMWAMGLFYIVAGYTGFADVIRDKVRLEIGNGKPLKESGVIRASLLSVACLFLTGYLVVYSLESPNSYILRLMEIIHLFVLVVVAWVWSVSVEKTVADVVNALKKLDNSRAYSRAASEEL